MAAKKGASTKNAKAKPRVRSIAGRHVDNPDVGLLEFLCFDGERLRWGRNYRHAMMPFVHRPPERVRLCVDVTDRDFGELFPDAPLRWRGDASVAVHGTGGCIHDPSWPAPRGRALDRPVEGGRARGAAAGGCLWHERHFGVHLGLGAGLHEPQGRVTQHHLDLALATGTLAGQTGRALVRWQDASAPPRARPRHVHSTGSPRPPGRDHDDDLYTRPAVRARGVRSPLDAM